MKRYLNYLISIFSLRKIVYKDISLFSYWDKKSDFTKYTRLGSHVRLLNSQLGKYTRISKGCSIVYTKIGNFCSVAGNVQIGAGRHPLNYLSTNQVFYNFNKLQNKWVHKIDFQENLQINIGSDVWIGTDSFIMGGVNIGHGAVIGAKSLVTKDIPPYAIAVGMPAKVIKYRFPPEVIEKLLKIKWWDFDDATIEQHIELFREPNIDLDTLNKYFPDN